MRNLLPHFILENYRSGHNHGSIPAVGMFVDISGFSQITDELMDHGQHGAEVLADVMRKIFSPLVQVTYEQGGFISTLAGDAFTAIYPIEDDQEIVSLRALSAAWEIQQELESLMTQATPYGEFVISGKIGIAVGEAVWGVVTSDDSKQAAYYIEGSAVEGSAFAEGKARPGEILVNSQFQSIAERFAEFSPEGDHYHVSGPDVEPLPPIPISLPILDSEVAYKFYPQSLYHQVQGGEFRQVVTMFINLPTVRTEDQLAIFMKSLFKLQDNYGGLLTRLDFGDKGSNLLMFWGAPVSFENDIERALNLILELQIQTSIPINAGITYRIAHAGFIGSVLREEYSTYGRGVNLAARFMAAAQRGDIWVDEEIAKRAEAKFEIEMEGEFDFKGFAQKQKVYILEERKEDIEIIFQSDLVGRQSELKELSEFIGPIYDNKYSGALVILGDPGIGKTRLVHEFSKLVQTDVLWSTCQCDQAIRESFNPFKYWMRSFFSISTYQNEARNKRNFNRRIDRLIGSLNDEQLAFELDRTRSFLGALIELYWPDSLYEQLDPKGRYENTVIGLINLIQAICTIQPVILQLEDTQWLDRDSWILLAQLERTIKSERNKTYPLAIIATTRGEFASSEFSDGVNFKKLHLGNLSQDSLKSLTDQLLDGPASDDLHVLVSEKAEGNPFFVEQIIKYLQDEALLTRSEGEWTVFDPSHSPLPENIRALLVSRLDRLANEVRHIVLTAAVIGREFDLQILSFMLGDDEALSDNVAKAEKSAIWSKISELRYLFNQALLLDAAYRMQVHSQRQHLHETAAKAIETIYSPDLVPYSADLAYHCEKAGLLDKACQHLIQSAKSAKNVYQNSQAVDFLTRALKLTSAEDVQAKIELILEREELLRLLGNFEERQKDLVYLENLLDSNQGEISKTDLAKYRLKIASRWASAELDQGNYSDALKHVQIILSIADQYKFEDDIFDAYYYWSQILYRQGDYPDAQSKGIESLQHAKTGGNREAESRILNTLGMISLTKERSAEAKNYFEKSLNIAKDINNLRDQAMPLNNLGNVALDESNFASAQDYYQQSLAIARQIGDLAGEGLVLGNLGFIAGIQGEYLTAKEFNERSILVARQAGNLILEAYNLINNSSVLRNLKEFPDALSDANHGLNITQEIKDRNGEAWALTSLGNINFELDDYSAAESAFTRAVEIRDSLNQPNLASEPQAGLARIALKKGDTQNALELISPIVEYLEEDGTLDSTDDPIQIYLTCFQILDQAADPRAVIPLSAGHQLINSMAKSIEDELVRKNYLENIPHNREILSAWESHHQSNN